MNGRRLLTVALVVACGALATGASADRMTVPLNAPQPWAGGAKVLTPIEGLAAQIASRIAGHPVSVSCEGVPRFRSNSSIEALGEVHTLVDEGTNQYASTATVISLTSQVCGPLQRFAQLTQKPTRCSDPQRNAFVPCFGGAPVSRHSSVPAVCWGSGCYSVVVTRAAYWNAYRRYSEAILVLAHEAIHTQQAVAGHSVPSAALIETQAECYGMQWMPWVAMQLGDASDDAQSIATFAWLVDYPNAASLHAEYPYWSPDCRPGGKLDIRAADALWP